MGAMTKVSAAVLVAAVVVSIVARTPSAESPRLAEVEPLAADVEPVGAADVSAADDPATEAVRSLVEEEPPVGVSAALGTNVLRVVLEGITEEDAPMTTVTLTAVDEHGKSTDEIRDSWPCQGLTSEFDLDPFLASVERHEHLRGELEVEVDHPHHLRKWTRVPLSRDVEPTNGKTVHEVRVRLVRPEFWPEFTLDVRDAHTLVHLENVELRIRSGPGMAAWGRNEMSSSTLLGGGLRSPIALMGGRDAGEERVTVVTVLLSK